MVLSAEHSHCGACGDSYPARTGDCCGRCQRVVCRACSQARDRSRESVLCVECSTGRKPGGVTAYRALRRWLKG